VEEARGETPDALLAVLVPSSQWAGAAGSSRSGLVESRCNALSAALHHALLSHEEPIKDQLLFSSCRPNAEFTGKRRFSKRQDGRSELYLPGAHM
jgi:hypothetical protein